MDGIHPKLMFYGFVIDELFEWMLLIVFIFILLSILYKSSGAKELGVEYEARGKKISLQKIFTEYIYFLKSNDFLVKIALVSFGMLFLGWLITIPYFYQWPDSINYAFPILDRNTSIFGFFLFEDAISTIPKLLSFGRLPHDYIWWLLLSFWLKRKVSEVGNDNVGYSSKYIIALNVIISIAILNFIFEYGQLIWLALGPGLEKIASEPGFYFYLSRFISFSGAAVAFVFLPFFITLILVLKLNAERQVADTLKDTKRTWKAVFIVLLPYWLWRLLYAIPHVINYYYLDDILLSPDGRFFINKNISFYQPESVLFLMLFYLIVLTVNEKGKIRPAWRKYWTLFKAHLRLILGIPLIACVAWLPVQIFFDVINRAGGKIIPSDLMFVWVIQNNFIFCLQYILFLFYAGFCWMVFNEVYRNHLFLVQVDDSDKRGRST